MLATMYRPVLPTEWCYNFEQQCNDHWVKMGYDSKTCTVEQCCPVPRTNPGKCIHAGAPNKRVHGV